MEEFYVCNVHTKKISQSYTRFLSYFLSLLITYIIISNKHKKSLLFLNEIIETQKNTQMYYNNNNNTIEMGAV